MDLPGVSIADEGETGMFSLRTIRGHQVSRGSGQTEGTEGEGPMSSVLNDAGLQVPTSPTKSLGGGLLGAQQ